MREAASEVSWNVSGLLVMLIRPQLLVVDDHASECYGFCISPGTIGMGGLNFSPTDSGD